MNVLLDWNYMNNSALISSSKHFLPVLWGETRSISTAAPAVRPASNWLLHFIHTPRVDWQRQSNCTTITKQIWRVRKFKVRFFSDDGRYRVLLDHFKCNILGFFTCMLLRVGKGVVRVFLALLSCYPRILLAQQHFSHDHPYYFSQTPELSRRLGFYNDHSTVFLW